VTSVRNRPYDHSENSQWGARRMLKRTELTGKPVRSWKILWTCERFNNNLIPLLTLERCWRQKKKPYAGTTPYLSGHSRHLLFSCKSTSQSILLQHLLWKHEFVPTWLIILQTIQHNQILHLLMRNFIFGKDQVNKEKGTQLKPSHMGRQNKMCTGKVSENIREMGL